MTKLRIFALLLLGILFFFLRCGDTSKHDLNAKQERRDVAIPTKDTTSKQHKTKEKTLYFKEKSTVTAHPQMQKVQVKEEVLKPKEEVQKVQHKKLREKNELMREPNNEKKKLNKKPTSKQSEPKNALK